MQATKPQVPASVRNQRFALLTRQNKQALPSIALPESSTVRFTLDQARYTAGLTLEVDGTFVAIHAGATDIPAVRHQPYNYLRSIAVDINNGFSPFKVSGNGLYLYNLMCFQRGLFTPIDSNTSREMTILENTTAAGPGGATDIIRFALPMPFTLNKRDPIGLINTQNPQTQVNVTIDTDSVFASIMASTAGYSTGAVSIAARPLVESFSIPKDEENRPDLSVIKLVQEQVFPLAIGENILKLPVGTTFRKLIFDCYTAANVALTDVQVTSVDLALNVTEKPYHWLTKQLVAENAMAYGGALPAGVFAIDFTDQGIPNYGGSRDYVDSERLTEMWLVINSTAAGFCRVVHESLARLRTN